MRSLISKLQSKPIVLLAIIALLSVIVIGWSEFAILWINREMNGIIHRGEGLAELEDTQVFLLEQVVAEQHYLLTGAPEPLVQHKQFETLANFHLNRGQRFESEAENLTIIGDIRTAQDRYKAAFTKTIARYASGDVAAAIRQSTQEDGAILQRVHEQMEALVTRTEQELVANVRTADWLTRLSLIISLVLLTVFLVIASIALSVDNRVLKPILLLAVLISFVVVAWHIYNIWRLDSEVRDVVTRLEEANQVGEIEVLLLKQEMAGLDYLLRGETAYISRYKELEATADQHWNRAISLQTTPEEAQLLNALKQDHDTYEQTFKAIVVAYQQGHRADAIRLSIEKAVASLDDVQRRVDDFVNQSELKLEEELAQVDRLTAVALTVGVFTLVILVVEAIISTSVTAQVLTPVVLLIAATREIENETYDTGMLDAVAQHQDEIGRLARIFQHMTQTVYTRTQQLKHQVQQLQIEIDEVKRQKQVSEVVDTDFFRNLQAKAHSIRSRRSEAASAENTLTDDAQKL